MIGVETPTPTRGPKGAQTRRAILDAAIDRFGRDGYRATSVADIARDAGVGGSVPYTYFADKEALFLAALDEDAAALVDEGLAAAFGGEPGAGDWLETLLLSLVESVERRPLARRLLGGLEPAVTERVLDIPALNELRKACAERLHLEQLAGRVRADIDPTAVGGGLVMLLLSLLMSMVQLGPGVAGAHADDVRAVFLAALQPGTAGVPRG